MAMIAARAFGKPQLIERVDCFRRLKDEVSIGVFG